MKEYIDKEALLEIVGKMPLSWEYGKAVSDIYDIIKDNPAADVVERKRGEWIQPCAGSSQTECSLCGTLSSYGRSAFCPKCGADMRGGGGGRPCD